MKLTILMPCLNESETLGTCITKANDWIAGAGIDAEVLIADNGSTDGSQEIARELGARVVDVPQKGYGSALYHGVEAAKGRYVIMGDSDDSYDFSRLDAFVEKLDEGYDLVMGNRFAGGIEPGAMPWKNRHIGNPVLTLVGRVLFRCPAKDFHCGIRGFTKEAFERMDLRTSGMEFASEIVIKATLLDMSITEVPTTLSRDGRSRPPHLRPWRDGWRHLRFMLLFSPRWLFLIPGLILLVPSLVSYLILLSGPARIGSVSFDVHTLFFAQAGMILGFTTVALGVILRMFAAREGLLSQRRMLRRLRDSPVLELGGIAGIAMITAGIWVGADLLVSWSATDFGRLRVGGLLRSVSLSTTLVIFGGLTILLSLIMGFLSLPTRNQRYEA
ncbi:MAG: glycosyltransferase family 2 protein [Aeromicrobium sp.]